MNIKLRFLLFYIHKILQPFNVEIPPHIMREINNKRLEKDEKIIAYPPLSMYKVKDKQIEMRDGAQIPIRIYTPTNTANLPVIVFYHGGGFVLRSIDSHDRACRRIAKASKAIVVSVGYRLAPEFKFPIPLHDCYDAFHWVSQNTELLGGDPDRIIVMGDSAGGNLAAVTAILARAKKGPKIYKQVLIYPTVDARVQFPSIDKYANGYFLTKEMIIWFRDHYIRTEADILNPLVSPLLKQNLSDLPEAFITTAALDPLKDEGEAYAKKLEEQGNKVSFKEYPKVIHGMLNMPKIMKASDEMVRDIAAFIAKP